MSGKSERTDHLRDLFDQFPTAILVADDEADYVDANRAACRLLERSREEIVGHNLREFIDPGRAEEVSVQWQAFLRDGSQSGLFSLRLPDGSVRTVQFHAQADFSPGLHCSFLEPVVEPASDSAARDPSAEGAGEDGDTVKICAWTKKVLLGDEWVRLETYLSRVHGLRVTHGLSPGGFPEDAEAR